MSSLNEVCEEVCEQGDAILRATATTELIRRLQAELTRAEEREEEHARVVAIQRQLSHLEACGAGWAEEVLEISRDVSDTLWWSCRDCTFYNHPDLTNCKMCEQPRCFFFNNMENAIETLRLGLSKFDNHTDLINCEICEHPKGIDDSRNLEIAIERQWSCRMCTFDNHPDLINCEMCECPKGTDDEMDDSPSISSTRRQNPQCNNNGISVDDFVNNQIRTYNKIPEEDISQVCQIDVSNSPSISSPRRQNQQCNNIGISVDQVCQIDVSNSPQFRPNVNETSNLSEFPKGMSFREFENAYKIKVYYSGAAIVPHSRVVREWERYNVSTC